MFRASLCPSSGAYQLQQQPLVYRRNVLVAVLLVIRTSETCWAVSKRQTINLYFIAASSWFIHLNVWTCTHLQTLNVQNSVRLNISTWRTLQWRSACGPMRFDASHRERARRRKRHHHHHHVQEGLGLIAVPCILKMKLVPPSLPRSSYVSWSFWFIL